MNKQEAEILLEKYGQGNVSAAELALLQHWYMQQALNNKAAFGSDDEKAMLDEIWTNVNTRIQAAPKKVKLWPRIAVAAAAVAAISFGIWFFTSRNTNTTHLPELVSGSQDIAPGKQGATLTLANGKKIRLTDASNGQLAKEGGVTITKTADGQVLYSLSSGGEKSEGQRGGKTNTLSTAKGETYVVTLPDKSKVWLNALSSITYSASLNERGLRRVRLEGEAYFEVAKLLSPSGRDGRRPERVPFIVQTAKQEVEVLGTHFNINSYSDEPAVKTTLLEGSVRVSSLSSGGEKSAGKRGETILKPNQQSVLANNTFTVSVADPNATAWVKGKFRFENTTLQDVMKQISRWYDVEVEYPNGIAEKRFSGDISRNNNLSDVLKVMKIMNLKFRVEGKKIIVEK